MRRLFKRIISSTLALAIFATTLFSGNFSLMASADTYVWTTKYAQDLGRGTPYRLAIRGNELGKLEGRSVTNLYMGKWTSKYDTNKSNFRWMKNSLLSTFCIHSFAYQPSGSTYPPGIVYQEITDNSKRRITNRKLQKAICEVCTLGGYSVSTLSTADGYKNSNDIYSYGGNDANSGTINSFNNDKYIAMQALIWELREGLRNYTTFNQVSGKTLLTPKGKTAKKYYDEIVNAYKSRRTLKPESTTYTMTPSGRTYSVVVPASALASTFVRPSGKSTTITTEGITLVDVIKNTSGWTITSTTLNGKAAYKITATDTVMKNGSTKTFTYKRFVSSNTEPQYHEFHAVHGAYQEQCFGIGYDPIQSQIKFKASGDTTINVTINKVVYDANGNKLTGTNIPKEVINDARFVIGATRKLSDGGTDNCAIKVSGSNGVYTYKSIGYSSDYGKEHDTDSEKVRLKLSSSGTIKVTGIPASFTNIRLFELGSEFTNLDANYAIDAKALTTGSEYEYTVKTNKINYEFNAQNKERYGSLYFLKFLDNNRVNGIQFKLDYCGDTSQNQAKLNWKDLDSGKTYKITAGGTDSNGQKIWKEIKTLESKNVQDWGSKANIIASSWYETNYPGYVQVRHLPFGTYRIREVEQNGVLQPKNFVFKIDSRGFVCYEEDGTTPITGILGVTSKWTKRNEKGAEVADYSKVEVIGTVPKWFSNNNLTYRFDNTTQKIKLNIVKIDEGTAKPIKNNSATFKISTDEPIKIGTAIDVEAGTVLGTVKTNNNGQLTFTHKNLIAGYTYRIDEVTPPKGYIKHSDPIRIPIKKNNTAGTTIEYTQKVPNKATGGIEVTKISDLDPDEGLNGAKFIIYEYKNNTPTGYTTNLVTTTINGKAGKAIFKTVTNGDNTHLIQPDDYDYYIAEIEPPTGYANKGTIEINGNDPVEFNNSDKASADYTQFKLSFNKDTDNIVKASYIAKAEVVVTESSEASLSLNKVATDKSTISSMNGTQYTVYYSESSMNNSSFTIGTKTWNATNKNYTRTVTINSAAIKKIGYFTINSSGTGVPTSIDTDFTIKKNAIKGPIGYYAVIETKCNEGNAFDNTNIYIRHLKDNSESIKITSKDPSITIPFDLTIEKSVAKTDNVMTLNKNMQFNEAINGTQFTLKFYKGLSKYDEITSSTTPTKTIVYNVKGASSSTPGKIDFSSTDYIVNGDAPYKDNKWPIGLFVIKETKTTDNFKLNINNWYTKNGDKAVNNTANAILARIVTNSKGNLVIQYNINGSWRTDETANFEEKISGENEKERGGLELQKYLNNTNTTLGNISFKLYYFSDAYYNKNSTVRKYISMASSYTAAELTKLIETNNLYEAIRTINVDSNGHYISTKNAYPVGHYIIIEQSNSKNKYLSGNGIKSFRISKDNITSLTGANSITNYTPLISTTEWDTTLSDADYKSHMSRVGNNVKINDVVKYTKFKPNINYTVRAILIDITDGTPKILRDTNNNIIQTAKTFKPTSTTDDPVSGSITVKFAAFDASTMYVTNLDGTNKAKIADVSGRKFVVYEYVFDSTDTTNLTDANIIKLLNNQNVTDLIYVNGTILGHYDMTDINQIGYFPKIHTTEADFNVPGHISPMWEEDGKEYIEVKDVLSYSNLDASRDYEVRISIRNAENDEEIFKSTEKLYNSKYTGSGKKLATAKADGTSSGKMTTDKITVDVTGVKSFYICEKIYLIDTNILVASHTDKIDSQTGYVARIGTKVSSNRIANELVDSILEVYAAKNITLTDTVTYENLGGYNYRIVCEYHYVGGEHNGEIVKDANGKALTRTITSNNLTNGSINVTITGLDCSKLKDETIVAYETFYYTDSNGTEHVIAKEHKDDSITQSLRFVGIIVNFNKVNQYGEFIKDTGLEIRKTTENGELIDTWTTDGEMHSVELDDGTYYLVETKAPNGYALNKSVKFTVNDCKLYLNGKEIESLSITLTDPVLTALPDAGGIGTIPFVCAGMILMLVSAAFVLKKKDQES